MDGCILRGNGQFLICNWQQDGYSLHDIYLNLLGTKTSVIGVDTKSMGQIKYVCRILTAKSDGRRTLWRNKCRQYDNVSGRVLGCKLDSCGSG